MYTNFMQMKCHHAAYPCKQISANYTPAIQTSPQLVNTEHVWFITLGDLEALDVSLVLLVPCCWRQLMTGSLP